MRLIREGNTNLFQDQMAVVIEEVNADNVIVRDRFFGLHTISKAILRTRMAPRAGEVWLMDRTYAGAWTLSAYLGGGDNTVTGNVVTDSPLDQALALLDEYGLVNDGATRVATDPEISDLDARITNLRKVVVPHSSHGAHDYQSGVLDYYDLTLTIPTVSSPTQATITMGTGLVIFESGDLIEVTEDQTVDGGPYTTASNLYRHDLVCVKLNQVTSEPELVVVQGTEATSPSPPALPDSWHIPLAVWVRNNGDTYTGDLDLGYKRYWQPQLAVGPIVETYSEDPTDQITTGGWVVFTSTGYTATLPDGWLAMRLVVDLSVDFFVGSAGYYELGAALDVGGSNPNVLNNIGKLALDGTSFGSPPSGTINVHSVHDATGSVTLKPQIRHYQGTGTNHHAEKYSMIVTKHRTR